MNVRIETSLSALIACATVMLAACASTPPPCPSAVKPPTCPTCPAPSAAESKPDPESSASGVDAVKARLLARVNAGDADGLFAMFDPRMQQAVPLDSTRSFMSGIVQKKGKLLSATRTAGETSATQGSYAIRAERGEWRLELHLDPDGRIAGLKFTDPPAPDPPVEKSSIPLRLPLEERFHVFWGGDRIELNHHINHKSQRRAADIVIRGEDGKSHTGDGKRNADYLIWGKQVLAVADGKVVTAVDGVPESEPGRLNGYIAVGNMVVIEHAPKLFSMVAHLQRGSVRVKVGQRVRAGTVLGKVGNSGNSSEPHLHFQLQDGPAVEASYGIEPVFSNVRLTRNGAESEPSEYTFLKGDVVGPK